MNVALRTLLPTIALALGCAPLSGGDAIDDADAGSIPVPDASWGGQADGAITERSSHDLWEFDPVSGALLTNTPLDTHVRYADGPCAEQPVGQCAFEARAIREAGNARVEVILAAGKIYEWDLAVGAPTELYGQEIASVPRFSDLCAESAGDCVIGSLTYVPVGATVWESISVDGKYYNFDVGAGYALVAGGQALESVPRYLGGPCQSALEGQCVFDSRTTYKSGAVRVESITAYGRRWDFHDGQPAEHMGTSLFDIPEWAPACDGEPQSGCTIGSRDVGLVDSITR